MDDAKNLTLRDYLRIIFRYKFMIAALVATTVITVHIGLEMRTPIHNAGVQMYIAGMKRSEVEYYRGIVAGDIISGHSQLVQSSVVVERVVEALELYKRPLDYEKKFASKLKVALIDYNFGNQLREFNQLPEEERHKILFQNAISQLKSSISVVSSENSAVFTINVKDFSPYEAVRIANALSRSYVIFDLEQQVLEFELGYGERNLKTIQIKNHIEDLKKHLDGRLLPNIEAIGPASVKIIEQALSAQPMRYKPSKSVARVLSFFISLSLGILIAFGLDFLNQTIQSPHDIESFFHLTFLGSIPRIKSLRERLIKDINSEKIKYTQFYQTLSSQIYVMMKGQNKKIVLIADAEGSADTAYVIANIGICLSNNARHKILIIDANLKLPSIDKIFNISNNAGVTEILEGAVRFEDAIQEVRTNLYVIPSGKTVFNPLPILQTSAMKEVIEKSREPFELVFVIGADLRNSSDSIILSSFTDGFILVVNEGQVKQQIVKRAIAPLEQKNINIIGVIINNRKFIIPEIIYKIT